MRIYRRGAAGADRDEGEVDGPKAKSPQWARALRRKAAELKPEAALLVCSECDEIDQIDRST